jgi:hypothetical protein
MRKSWPLKRPLPTIPLPVRMFLLAIIAVVASVYALVRYYTRLRPPMLVPVDTSEIPAPELEPISD